VTPRLSPLFELKAASLTAAGEFSGYASTFGGDPDSYGDVIAAGAFKASLAEHKSRGTMPALLWSHSPDEPIGRWVQMAEDARGLAVTGALTLEVEKAREAHALAKAGALALSIGFRVAEGGATYDNEGTRVLRQIELWEVSLVAMPANHRARIESVKSAPDVAAIEDLLRKSFDVSGRDAKRMASGAWAARSRTQHQPQESQQVAELFRAATLKLGAK
jgi:HK97 family phage prohead protease